MVKSIVALFVILTATTVYAFCYQDTTCFIECLERGHMDGYCTQVCRYCDDVEDLWD